MGSVLIPNFYAAGRLKSGKKNQTETAYSLELESQKVAGVIVWYAFESLTFKLAEDTRYTPDFIVMYPDGQLECREVKSLWRDDAKVKIKVASQLFPFRFVAIYAQPKKLGGGWRVEDFS